MRRSSRNYYVPCHLILIMLIFFFAEAYFVIRSLPPEKKQDCVGIPENCWNFSGIPEIFRDSWNFQEFLKIFRDSWKISGIPEISAKWKISEKRAISVSQLSHYKSQRTPRPQEGPLDRPGHAWHPNPTQEGQTLSSMAASRCFPRNLAYLPSALLYTMYVLGIYLYIPSHTSMYRSWNT